MSGLADLIPHSGRMVLLDRILGFDDHGLTAELKVRGDGLLGGDERRVPAWVGIEYMAQAAAVYQGIKARQANGPVRSGFLLGTRLYESNVSDFEVGSILTVQVEKITQHGGLMVFDCRIKGTDVEVTAHLNVFQPAQLAIAS